MNSSRPEHELLHCIASSRTGHGKAAKLISLLEPGLNWEYVFVTATDHGLIPLLHKHLSAIDGPVVPDQLRVRLKRESVANSQSVLHLTGQLLKILKLFGKNGIRTAAFKGPVLSQMAYGEMLSRQAGDIDLLIHPAKFFEAKALLESLGYHMSPELTPAQLKSHLAFHCEIQFIGADWFTVVDLHWGLAPKSFVFDMTTDQVMSRLQSISFAGAEIETFGAEDLIVYQCMHGAKHLWRRLEWIASLADLIRPSDKVDWTTVVERATSAHGARMLALGLRLVERISDVEVPGFVFNSIDPNNEMLRFASDVDAQLFTHKSFEPDSTETSLYNLKIMDRKRDAIRSALRALFVPTLSDWEALSLPPRLHSFYYAFRPLRLSKSYGVLLWRKLANF